MKLRESLSSLVGEVYEAALDADALQPMMDRLTRILDGTGSAIVHTDPSGRSTMHVAVLPSDAIHSYSAYFGGIDPVARRAPSMAVGTVVDTRHLIGSVGDRDDEFTVDWARPHNIGDALSVVLERRPDAVSWLVAAGTFGGTFADPERIRFLETLAPHVRRAARIQKVVRDTGALSDSSAAAIDRLTAGVLLVRGGRVVFANPVAMARLRGPGGLHVDRAGRLSVGPTAENARLERLLAGATRPATEGIGTGGSVVVSAGPSARLVVHILPLPHHPRTAGYVVPDGTRTAMVVVVDPLAKVHLSAELLRTLYGLTRAEAVVAERVAEGHGLSYVADALCLTMSTVRTHLQHVFHKLGVCRQAELIAVLNGVQGGVDHDAGVRPGGHSGVEEGVTDSSAARRPPDLHR